MLIGVQRNRSSPCWWECKTVTLLRETMWQLREDKRRLSIQPSSHTFRHLFKWTKKEHKILYVYGEQIMAEISESQLHTRETRDDFSVPKLWPGQLPAFYLQQLGLCHTKPTMRSTDQSSHTGPILLPARLQEARMRSRAGTHTQPLQYRIQAS